MATAPPQQTSAAESSELPVVNIGTRRSVLARVQTDIVEAALKEAWPERKYAIHAMATMGDKNQTTALHEFGAKSLWTHELEALLAKGELDMIVHSLKGEISHNLAAVPFERFPTDVQNGWKTRRLREHPIAHKRPSDHSILTQSPSPQTCPRNYRPA